MSLANRTHGKPGTYQAGCRCDECRDAWRRYNRPYMVVEERVLRLCAQYVKTFHPDTYADIRRTAREGKAS